MSAFRTGIAVMAGCAFLALVTPKTPHLIWNATASAATGLYLVKSNERFRAGDLVLALPPPALQDFAAHRGYLPRGVPLVKYVAAIAGDRVCGKGKLISINAHVVVIRLAADSLGRPLPAWTGCRTLQKTDVLLLNAKVTHSFDSRYFGPISTAAIIGKLVPLWVR